MRFTKNHDILFLRELLLFEPWNFKQGTTERKNVYENISVSLNSLTQIKFKVAARSLRDRLRLLRDNFRKREREEERASGISPEETEIDAAIREIVEHFDHAEETQKNQSQEKKDKVQNDMSKAVEIRKRSMETLAETNYRIDETPKKRRNSRNETLQSPVQSRRNQKMI